MNAQAEQRISDSCRPIPPSVVHCTRHARQPLECGMLRTALSLVIAAIATGGGLQPAQPSAPFDVLIQNGRVMDGTGNPWLRADIGIRADRIAAIGRLTTAQARTTSRIVALLPFAALALGELAAPGLLERIAASPTGLWLLGSAVALQLTGAFVVVRLSRLQQ